MDSFWNQVYQDQGRTEWGVRSQVIEEAVLKKVTAKVGSKEPVRCLELGTYCGYSALRIAKNLPEGSTLLSVEKDPLFAAIATKVVEFAGLESKVKIWIGTVPSELTNIMEKLEGKTADFILCDHSKERFVPDLKILEECGAVTSATHIVGDVDVYPGDQPLSEDLKEEIAAYFHKTSAFAIAHIA